jgi:acyl-CoA reductase-like NAD-dependent aldehyde dehydrogenase
MLTEFNEGRSKSYYCVAATVLRPDELRAAIDDAREAGDGTDVRERARALHAALEATARSRSLRLALRG